MPGLLGKTQLLGASPAPVHLARQGRTLVIGRTLPGLRVGKEL